jgi:hypothetical protein
VAARRQPAPGVPWANERTACKRFGAFLDNRTHLLLHLLSHALHQGPLIRHDFWR